MEEYVVQLRGLNEAVYCERLFHLMYAQGLFINNADTITGKMHHDIRENTERNNKIEGVKTCSMVLYAYEGILSGKLDSVIISNGEYIPVEDKNSKIPEVTTDICLWGVDISTPIWINDFPQIVGEMYILRKNGYRCNRGRVYYRGSNKMIDIFYEDRFDQLIENGIEHCIEILQGSQPKPLLDSDKCIRCSLNWVCLPDEVNTIQQNCTEPRRLYPGRPDTSILYVTSVGAKIGKSGECLSVWTVDQGKKEVPIKDIEHVCVFGNVQITTQAIHEIIKNEGTICYFTSGGWFTAITSAPVTKNIKLRINQFELFKDEAFCVKMTKNIILSKIANQRTLIRRNRNDNQIEVLNELKRIREKVFSSNELNSIRGYEGMAAKIYWNGYKNLFRDSNSWKMEGRNRRPPRDEINAMLSYGYTLLLRDFVSALISSGMDHLYGFFHTVIPGRPSLALDLMEPYRPLIVDSTVLRMINEDIVKKTDFATTEAGVFMSPQVKKRLIYMYEKRMDEMITHPQFGYRLSYRRMIHLEVKLFGKYLQNDIDDYVPLITR